jgi:glycosyltransferase involved in cell wall biosynthesis
VEEIKSTSVIIPTYNGAHKILNVLRSIEKQVLKPSEVIVVIDGSTDGTRELLKKSIFTLPGLKIIEQENRGRAQVRNRGAAEAKGELLLFIDDDMIASEHWVKAHTAHHTLFKDTLMTGREEDANEVAINDYHKFRLWQHHRWTNFDFEPTPHESSKALKNVYITASNFSIQRTLFLKLNGFDERLNDAEDYDLAVRAKQQGYPIYWNYDALAYNNDVDNVTCLKSILRQRQYARAHEQLREIKPDIYNKINGRSTYKPNAMKSIVFKGLCSKWWVHSVDEGFWTWLPEKLRFRLYDLIITANGAVFPKKVKLP